MKKVLIAALILLSLSAAAQNKTTVRELLFSGQYDEKNKIIQVSKDGELTRVLRKITNENSTQASKYILVENDTKGTLTNSLFIFSKADIPQSFDLFDFKDNSAGIIYYDPVLGKLITEPDNKKVRKVSMKNGGTVIDASTAIAVPECNESGEAPYCIDWYWQTWEGDILIDEEYQFTTCDCHQSNGGGGGNTNPNNPEPPQEEDCAQAEDDIKGTPVSVQEFSSLISQSSDVQEIEYTWKFYKQLFNLWYFTSHEKGTHKKVHDQWNWQALEHQSISRSGIFIGGTIECTLNSAISTLGKVIAGMELAYNIEASVVCKGSPISASDNHKSKATFSTMQSLGAPITIQPVY